ncbi:glycoside hydrolase family 10 protein [Tellurirhabdus bombi]|uniref:glycoside hydrolase family 10 protein n=1 Tax=Tellurirhabdus bombi TaxID=2907205 RepID=UPI001F2F9BA5|nr:family 10 glycosylhydrolase [Tellurirhabdus bombi]
MSFPASIFPLLFVFLFGSRQQPTAEAAEETPSPPKREFRAVWIATVGNMDWPSKGGLLAEEQQAEFINILDQHQRAGINAVVVQVRAAADAFYAKSFEPWSYWLTGKQGQPPEPFYDPLEFMIQETHSRGMEFHAWFNLDRATFSKKSVVAPDHISLRRPDWMLPYGERKLFNLGLPDVRTYVASVVTNIVRNYDVDGIHFDDYFYPYAVPGQVFKDDSTYRAFYNGQSRDDWRRTNVDKLIKQLHDSIQVAKPYVKFGISPFGVWKNHSQDPEGSPTYGGMTAYYNLYADVRKWVKEGWIDYVAPQVYFSAGFDKVPYRALVEWWTRNSFNRHLYIGHGVYRFGNVRDKDKNWMNPKELPNQVRYNRQFSGVHGSIYFSSTSLTRNLGNFRDSLLTDLNRYPALVPPMPWKDAEPPYPPRQAKAVPTPIGMELTWQQPEDAADGDKVRYYVVYRFNEEEKVRTEDPRHILSICVGEKTTHYLDRTAKPGERYVYVLTAVDRLHNESALIRVNVQQSQQ